MRHLILVLVSSVLISITTAAAGPINQASTPIPSARPELRAEYAPCHRIRFAPGGTSTEFTVQLSWYEPRCYILWARRGQQMFITAVGHEERPFIAVFGPALRFMRLSRIEGMERHWVVSLPQTGDYRVILTGQGETWVTIEIPPL